MNLDKVKTLLLVAYNATHSVTLSSDKNAHYVRIDGKREYKFVTESKARSYFLGLCHDNVLHIENI